jgi:glucose-1-phosphate thymidylyltransferase
MITKGILLAGGAGTRLGPLTLGVCKQLLPVYDKPMVYYPLSVLMLAGIRDVLIIGNPPDLPAFERVLGDGVTLGLTIAYAEQTAPRGIADALRLGASHAAGGPVALVLGDNLFFGAGFGGLLRREAAQVDGCTLFAHRVRDPQRFGVVEMRGERAVSIEEKPTAPRSPLAVTGLYFYDADAVRIAANLRPSPRGELEITDVNRAYVEAGRARVVELGRGMAWMDMGTPGALLEASQFVQAIEHRQGLSIACPEEIALHRGWIDGAAVERAAARFVGSSYCEYLRRVAARPAR